MTTELTIKQEVPTTLAELIEGSEGRVTGLVQNDRDEFVDVSFDGVQDGYDFQNLLHQAGYNVRVFQSTDKRATVRIYA